MNNQQKETSEKGIIELFKSINTNLDKLIDDNKRNSFNKSVNLGPKIDPKNFVMKKHTFYWLDGTRQVLIGDSVADALQSAGYGAGALHALDFVANGEDDAYIWTEHHWVKKAPKPVILD